MFSTSDRGTGSPRLPSPQSPILTQFTLPKELQQHENQQNATLLLVLLDLTDASFLITKPLCWVVPESVSYIQFHN
jgi:hypothetical protein